MSDGLSMIAAAAGVLAVALLLVLLALCLRLSRAGAARDETQRLRLMLEQVLAGQRAEAETSRSHLAAAERALATRVEQVRLGAEERLGALTTALVREQGESRALLETKLREMAEANAARLAEIQREVSEGLHAAVEKQMQGSFQRVIDQFAAVQKAMGDVQAVTAQIGDLKRLFSNVKTRGGWGEAQLRALLDDVLPEGAYETNRRLRDDSAEVVEFAVRMPGRGEARLLPIDAKFPVEDYERLLLAAEQGDSEGERAARRALEGRLRAEARKIADKYIVPPLTVEFAILYLPTDGLYAEVARSPGLIDEIGRTCRVLVMGPALVPALLRTIHLGYVTLALEQKADAISQLLGATKQEMLKMDEVLEKLARNAGTMSRTIDDARRRTRAVGRKLRAVGALEAAEAEALLELEGAGEDRAGEDASI
ncbi:MAG TPA: DNA recombination protein RmuC [Acetobacteraceae bacterium]|nr:DNA recombination protein RmuC [Acetobacteraceae bacterium]